MPEVNLTSLSGPELRRLLDSTRARGQASLSYLILQEMAARREDRGRRGLLAGRRRPAEPRTIALDLDDPPDEALDIPPAPYRRPPMPSATPTEAPVAPLEPPVADVAEAQAAQEPPAAAPLPDLELDRPAAPSQRRGWSLGGAAAAGFAAGMAATAAFAVAVGWAPGPLRVTPPPAAPVSVAEPAPLAVHAPAPHVVHEALPEPMLTTAEAPESPCAAAPTPADRTICGDPELLALQQDLRRAYADALAAHQDRETLRERQLAWRDQRNPVAEPAALAQMYRERIRRLNAAAEAARRLRGA